MGFESRYEIVIGLEVHAHLKTSSKLFCACPAAFGATPNRQVCPVCLGLPGALPVLNRQAVAFAVRAALALRCRINLTSVFARKNYFYPDLPKGYQISQFDLPVAEQGYLDIDSGENDRRRIGITRIHLEDDAGKSVHLETEDASLLDYNRSGVPLIEIVSEPDLRSPVEAAAYMRLLRQVLRYLDICDGNMEEGSLRCDANLSLRPFGQEAFGTRTELKNLNSFKFVERALSYEARRHAALLDAGQAVQQETRLFDSHTGETHSMRGKEESHDYRYFPDPDLAPLTVSDEFVETQRRKQPEMPWDARLRVETDYELPSQDALLLTAERSSLQYLDRCIRAGAQPKRAANWIMADVLRDAKETGGDLADFPLSPEELANLLVRLETGNVSVPIAKAVYHDMLRTGQTVDAIIAANPNYQLMSDTDELVKHIETAMQTNPQAVDSYRAGNRKALGALIGPIMRATKGQADPVLVNRLLIERLEKDA